MNTNQKNAVYFLEKPKKDLDTLYLSATKVPIEILDEFRQFISEKGFDKLSNYEIINIAKKNGAIVNYEYSYYKSHTSITIDNQIYVCEQFEPTISKFFMILNFLGIINF